MLTDHKMASIEKSHAYPTRSKKVPNRPSAKLSLYRNSFLYSSIKHFSELSVEIRESKTLYAFVRKCKKNDIQQLVLSVTQKIALGS